MKTETQDIVEFVWNMRGHRGGMRGASNLLSKTHPSTLLRVAKAIGFSGKMIPRIPSDIVNEVESATDVRDANVPLLRRALLNVVFGDRKAIGALRKHTPAWKTHPNAFKRMYDGKPLNGFWIPDTDYKTSRYWARLGKYQKQWDVLYDKLVPAWGKAPSVAGEVVRALSSLNHEAYNNGFGNDMTGPYFFLEDFFNTYEVECDGDEDAGYVLENLNYYVYPSDVRWEGRQFPKFNDDDNDSDLGSTFDSLFDAVYEFLVMKRPDLMVPSEHVDMLDCCQEYDGRFGCECEEEETESETESDTESDDEEEYRRGVVHVGDQIIIM
jgi:hypothetical protein